jgi:hypothetical protein
VLLVKPLVEAGRQQTLGSHDIDLTNAGHPRQQIEVCRPQTVRVRRSIRNRKNDVFVTRNGSTLEQQRSKRMLIDPPRFRRAAFELGERGREKLRLAQQALRTLVDLGDWYQLPSHETMEVIDGAEVASQLVVERKNLDDETWTNPERRRSSRGLGRPRGEAKQDLALKPGEQRR